MARNNLRIAEELCKGKQRIIMNCYVVAWMVREKYDVQDWDRLQQAWTIYHDTIDGYLLNRYYFP